MAETTRVGFIGLGMMGNPMSKRVLAAGYPLTVYDIRPEAVADVVQAGAHKADSPKVVAAVSDGVLTSLPTLQASEEVYLGHQGLVQGARAGTMLVETSTVSPQVVQRFAAAAAQHGGHGSRCCAPGPLYVPSRPAGTRSERGRRQGTGDGSGGW